MAYTIYDKQRDAWLGQHGGQKTQVPGIQNPSIATALPAQSMNQILAQQMSAGGQGEQPRERTQLDNLVEQLHSEAVAQRDAAIQARVQEQLKEDEKERLAKTQAQDEKDVLGSLIPTITPEEQERRQRMYSARQGIAALGNGLAALGNVIYTSNNAIPQQIPEVPDANGQRLQSWQDRLTQDRLRNTQLELAEQQRNAEEAYRAWQMQNTAEQQAQAQANADREYGLAKEKLENEQAENKSRSAETARQFDAQLAETIRSHKANEASDMIRARAEADAKQARTEDERTKVYAKFGLDKDGKPKMLRMTGPDGSYEYNEALLLGAIGSLYDAYVPTDNQTMITTERQNDMNNIMAQDIIREARYNKDLMKELVELGIATAKGSGGDMRQERPALDLSTISNSNTQQRPEWPRLKLNGK